MTLRPAILLLGLALPICGAGADSTLSKEAQEGREIINRILQSRPSEDSTADAVLKISKGRHKLAEIPVHWEVEVTDTNWRSRYETVTTNWAAQVLTIVQSTSGANHYEFGGVLSATTNLVTSTVPFAGSDFWAGDLGLEFLRWPTQRLLKKELRRSQACYVIESVNSSAAAQPYARVVSWIDIDSVRDFGAPAIVHADAYNADGKKVKVFEPSDFKKVNGQWQVEEMEMRNLLTGTKTRLVFDLKSKPE